METLERKPFMANFIEIEEPIQEPEFDELTQVHKLEGSNDEYIANMTTTAIPHHRDTV
jgi:hypothetical protein